MFEVLVLCHTMYFVFITLQNSILLCLLFSLFSSIQLFDIKPSIKHWFFVFEMMICVFLFTSRIVVVSVFNYNFLHYEVWFTVLRCFVFYFHDESFDLSAPSQRGWHLLPVPGACRLWAALNNWVRLRWTEWSKTCLNRAREVNKQTPPVRGLSAPPSKFKQIVAELMTDGGDGEHQVLCSESSLDGRARGSNVARRRFHAMLSRIVAERPDLLDAVLAQCEGSGSKDCSEGPPTATSKLYCWLFS